MNDDNYSRDLHAWIEPEIEARVVALILGEASEFEAEELDRLMEERPEIRSFKQRLEGLHGLLGESLEPTDDDDWKLPASRRDQLLESLDLAPPATSSVDLDAARDVQRERRVRRAGRRVIFSVAACFVVTLFFAALIATKQMAHEKAEREDTAYYAETAKAEKSSSSKSVASRRYAQDAPSAGGAAPTDRYDSEVARENRKSGAKTALAEMSEMLNSTIGYDEAEAESNREVSDEAHSRNTQASLFVDGKVTDERDAAEGEGDGDPFVGDEALGLSKEREAFKTINPTPAAKVEPSVDLAVPAAKPAPPAAPAVLPGTDAPASRPDPEPIPEESPTDPSATAPPVAELDAIEGSDYAERRTRGRGKDAAKKARGGTRSEAGGGGFNEDFEERDERGWKYRGGKQPAAPGLRKAPVPGREAESTVLDLEAGLYELQGDKLRQGQGQGQGQSEGQGPPSAAGAVGSSTRSKGGQGGRGRGSFARTDRQEREKLKPGGNPAPGPDAQPLELDSGGVESRNFYDDSRGNGKESWERKSVLGDRRDKKRSQTSKLKAKDLEVSEEEFQTAREDFNVPSIPGSPASRESRRSAQNLHRDNKWSLAEKVEGKPDGVLTLEPGEPGYGNSNNGRSKSDPRPSGPKADVEKSLAEQQFKWESLNEAQAKGREERTKEDLTVQGFGEVPDIDTDELAADAESAEPTPRPGESNFGRNLGKRDEAVERLRGTVLADANFNDMTLEAAVDFLRQKTQEAAKEEEGRSQGEVLAFEIAPESVAKRLAVKGKQLVEDDYSDAPPKGSRLRNLHMKNVRADEALKAVADQAGMRYEIQANGTVRLTPREPVQELFQHREWSVPLTAWRKIQGGRVASGEEITAESLIVPEGEQVRIDPRLALQNYGITLSEQEVVSYSSSTGKFSVSGKEDNLKKIDEVVGRSLAQVEREEKARDEFEKLASVTPTSTFSLHVSDVSFKLSKAALDAGQWPQAEKVRVEEFVNAFDYGDSAPSQKEKVAARLEQARHPFLLQRNVLRISMKTAALGRAAGTPLRLTILLDNSGSMDRTDRAAAVQKAFSLLAAQLGPQDRVTLIGFARTPRLLADGLKGDEAGKLGEVIASTPSEGGTNIEEALRKGIEKAREHFLGTGQNRIILLTDGAANLGNAEPEELLKMVEGMRQQGIAFDACGVGAEGLNDKVLESLTRKGDGRYYFLDRQEDADEGFAKQIAGALRPAARNVKVQLNFNPRRVGRYRLYGFDTHRLKKEDFLNDAVDAAEMAAEEAGNAIYQIEVLPEGEGEIGSVSVRFEDTATRTMVMRQWIIPYESDAPRFEEASNSLKLAGIAALTGEKLKGSIVGGSVDLPKLNKLVHPLPEAYPSSQRVADLAAMIARMRQIAAPAP